MTDPRVPVVPGIPNVDNPAVAEPVTSPPEPVAAPEATTPEPAVPVKPEIPSGNQVISGEDGNACTQEFLSHIFGSEFDKFRQSWQIAKG